MPIFNTFGSDVLDETKDCSSAAAFIHIWSNSEWLFLFHRLKIYLVSKISEKTTIAQSAGVVEYTDCTSAEG